MARTIPEGRFTQLVDVATKTFVARGYRLTQMSDIAEGLGVAKGTLYGYVESKEALFDAAVRYADAADSTGEPATLPVPTPPPGSTVAYVRDRLLSDGSDLELIRPLGAPTARAAADDLERLVRDLYRRTWRNRRVLKLVDRCAVDYPELAAPWFDEGRWALVNALSKYLETRIEEGGLRPLPNVQLAARMLLETVALWTIHMPWDPSPRPYDDDEAENAVVDMLVHAYAKEAAR